jgi:hypothetical protein
MNPYAYVENDPINWFDDEGLEPKGHTSGARESTREKHEKGDARRSRDRGGEKGDAKRRPPRVRPPGHKGPWPQRIYIPFILNPCLWAPQLMPPGYCFPEEGELSCRA